MGRLESVAFGMRPGLKQPPFQVELMPGGGPPDDRVLERGDL